MFSKHYDNGNKDLRFSQNGNYSFENLFSRKKNKKIIYYRDYETFNANLFGEETEKKEQKLMMHIVSTVKFYSEFHKALY